MIHDGLMDKLIHNRFKRWTQSEVLRNKLAGKVCSHSIITKRALKITSPDKAEGTIVQNESTVESKVPVKLSSMTS